MLSTLDIVHDLPRSRQRHRSLWHDASQYSPLLGCTICPDRKLCGGLQVEMPMFNCLGLCCGHPETCDSVCRNHPEEFARRIWEIGGFSFDNVPRAPVLDEPKLPRLVPLFFDGSGRRTQFQVSSAVCFPLYKVISRRDGTTRYKNQRALAESFKVSPELAVILTGTAFDPKKRSNLLVCGV